MEIANKKVRQSILYLLGYFYILHFSIDIATLSSFNFPSFK